MLHATYHGEERDVFTEILAAFPVSLSCTMADSLATSRPPVETLEFVESLHTPRD